MATEVKGEPVATTRFVGGDELREGDVIIDDEGNERRVMFAVLEGKANHLDIEGYEDAIVVCADDIFERKCGPGEV
jgi:hypothetical protein